MATGSLAMVDARPALDLDPIGRRAAQAAVGLTIGSATALAAFFAVGEPWGTLNDSLSICLAWATVPISSQFSSQAKPAVKRRQAPGAALAGAAPGPSAGSATAIDYLMPLILV